MADRIRYFENPVDNGFDKLVVGVDRKYIGFGRVYNIDGVDKPKVVRFAKDQWPQIRNFVNKLLREDGDERYTNEPSNAVKKLFAKHRDEETKRLVRDALSGFD